MSSYRSLKYRRYEEKKKNLLISKSLLLLFLSACFAITLAIIWPYRHAIILGFLLAMLSYPLQSYFQRLFKGRASLAAVSCILVLVLLLFGPAFFMSIAIIDQGLVFFELLQGWIAKGGPAAIEAWFVSKFDFISKLPWFENITAFYPGFDIQALNFKENIIKAVSSSLKFILKQGGTLAGNLGIIIGHFFLFILVFFVCIRNHDALLNRIFHLLPLSASQEELIFERIKLLVRSVFVGTFMTALVQGAAGGLAFFFVGLPGFFWGAVMAFASLIPVVGTALIWGPAVIWLWVSGHGLKALGLFLWCLLVVGSIDNFVRPLFMRGGAEMNGILVFFAILGGLQFFGFLGLLYGPLIFGLMSLSLYLYEKEFDNFLQYQNRH